MAAATRRGHRLSAEAARQTTKRRERPPEYGGSTLRRPRGLRRRMRRAGRPGQHSAGTVPAMVGYSDWRGEEGRAAHVYAWEESAIGNDSFMPSSMMVTTRSIEVLVVFHPSSRLMVSSIFHLVSRGFRVSGAAVVSLIPAKHAPNRGVEQCKESRVGPLTCWREADLSQSNKVARRDSCATSKRADCGPLSAHLTSNFTLEDPRCTLLARNENHWSLDPWPHRRLNRFPASWVRTQWIFSAKCRR